MATERDRKGRWLSEEEAELWAYVTRDARNLRRKRRKGAVKSVKGDAASSPSVAARDETSPASAKPASSSNPPSASAPPARRNWKRLLIRSPASR
jgi:hypothetical protein